MTVQTMSGGSYAAPSSITRNSAWTTVLIDTSVGVFSQLPSGCSVEDMVEVHFWNGPAINICPPNGEAYADGTSYRAGPQLFRKVSATLWSFP